MEIEPIVGTPVRFPPGRVKVRLDERYRLPYRRLYRQYQSFLSDLPVLRDQDFDGRDVSLSQEQLDTLNRALEAVGRAKSNTSVFGGQEASRTKLFKKTQFLS